MKKEVKVYRTSEFIQDIASCYQLDNMKLSLKSGIPIKTNCIDKQKCVFLDRDGTINKKKGFICHDTDLELEQCASEAIKKLNESDYLAIIITNQPVIAKGICSLDMLNKIHAKLEKMLGENGAYIDGLFYCPHLPVKIDEIGCSCRKPNIGLIMQAVDCYNIDLKQSYMIGDTTTDILCGQNAGMKTILVMTGDAGKDHKYNVHADAVCNNILDAVTMIINNKI